MHNVYNKLRKCFSGGLQLERLGDDMGAGFRAGRSAAGRSVHVISSCAALFKRAILASEHDVPTLVLSPSFQPGSDFYQGRKITHRSTEAAHLMGVK